MGLSPLVSVILPVYNGEPYLKDAINSILSQDYPNFELIIINDGSRDNSWDTIEAVSDPRVRAYSQENQGLPAALNRGIELAKGELIARADADDVSRPQRLSRQVAFLDQNPQVGLIGTSYARIDSNGKIIDLRFQLTDPIQIRRQIYVGNPFCHGSVMFRKSVVMSVGGYDTSALAEDYDLWSRLALKTFMVNLPEILYEYRINVEGSLVATNRKRFLKEDERIRTRLWAEGKPPALTRNAFLEKHSLIFETQLAFKSLISTPRFHYRSEARLQVLTSLEIAKRYQLSGENGAAWREWFILLLSYLAHPLQLMRILKHSKSLFLTI